MKRKLLQKLVPGLCASLVLVSATSLTGCSTDTKTATTASDADKLVRNVNKITAVLTDYLKHSADSDIRYRVYNHEGIFVGVYSYLDETGEFKPVKIFME